MGYIIAPFAVNLGRVTGVVGSKNQEFADHLIEAFEDDFEQFDEMAADTIDEEDESGAPALTMRAAITQMIMGEKYDHRFGFMYGYALEFICQDFGEFLPNGNWSAMPRGTQWAQHVDQELRGAGVPENDFSVTGQLMFRGAPITIPEIDDFPGIGYLTLQELKALREVFMEANLSTIKDQQVNGSIQELRGWFQSCVDSDRDLVCFYA